MPFFIGQAEISCGDDQAEPFTVLHRYWDKHSGVTGRVALHGGIR